MAVRFLPSPEDRPSAHREDRGDLAEVIEFRSRLRRPAHDEDSGPAAGADRGPRRAAGAGAGGAGGDGSGADGSGADGSGVGGSRASASDRPDRGDGRDSGLDGIPVSEQGGLRVIDTEALLGGRGSGGRAASAGAASGRAASGPAGSDTAGVENAERGRGRRSDSSRQERQRSTFEVIEGGAEDVPDEGPSASERAVRLLARKAMSSGELQRALVAAGHPEIDAEEAVAECERSLYLDDGDLASTLALKLRESKGESRSRIRQKLRERYLPSDVIEAALEELDDDAEHELLRQTAADRAKRLVDLDRQTAERRLLGFLARRGWSGERATRAAREALDGGPRSAGGGGSVRFR